MNKTSIILAAIVLTAVPVVAQDLEREVEKLIEKLRAEQRSKKEGTNPFIGPGFRRDESLPGKPIAYVALGGPSVTDRELRLVASLKHLATLDLDRTMITDEGLRELISAQELTSFSIEENNLNGTGYGYLGKLPKLKRVLISTDTPVIGGREGLSKLKQVEQLSLWGKGITDADLKQIEGLPRIQFVSVVTSNHDSTVTDDGIRLLMSLSDLQGVELGCAKLTDRSAEHLSKCKRLDTVNISRAKELSDDGLKVLAENGSLKRVAIFGPNRVTDAGVDWLKKKIPGAIISR
jgi:hypothetical protein